MEKPSDQLVQKEVYQWQPRSDNLLYHHQTNSRQQMSLILFMGVCGGFWKRQDKDDEGVEVVKPSEQLVQK